MKAKERLLCLRTKKQKNFLTLLPLAQDHGEFARQHQQIIKKFFLFKKRTASLR